MGRGSTSQCQAMLRRCYGGKLTRGKTGRAWLGEAVAVVVLSCSNGVVADTAVCLWQGIELERLKSTTRRRGLSMASRSLVSRGCFVRWCTRLQTSCRIHCTKNRQRVSYEYPQQKGVAHTVMARFQDCSDISVPVIQSSSASLSTFS